ncbi:MAG: FG-GAP repeat domain-containing protein, partial [Planctomycetota bacterium]
MSALPGCPQGRRGWKILARRRRASPPGLCFLLWAALLAAGGCDRPAAPGEAPRARDGVSPVSQAPGPEVAGGAGSDPGAPLGRSPEDDSDPIFTDRAEELGIDFQHFNGMSGEYFFCETVGPGGALFDYDNDGDLDIYLVQGAMLGRGKTLADATPAPRSPLPLTDRLYRNELVESGRLRFTEVTAEAGISGPGYGMGVAAGDINGDGWIDLYVTNFGPNQLLLNNGDRTFRDVTAASGTQDDRWNTSAAFVDHDRDGDLDLYVCAYVDFSYENHKPCYSETSARDYCGPLSYRALPDRLFRNRGDGTFEDASAVSQIVREYGAALGVVCTDLNGDGWIDIYVANDGHPNQCWMNRRDGTFVNEALLGGCAYNEQGKAEASMGVDAADFDGDGDEDLFMTHLTDETNTLYLNDGSGYFDDYSFETGLGVASRAFTGFGTAWFDFDSDGWLDLLIANGAVKTIEALAAAGDPYPLHQKNQLFHNLGNGRFEEITSRAGRVFSLSEVSRGAAFGDLDNDGDPDVLVMNNAGR